jgi:acid stress-induced BolA-like protein IbaG/YrbA
MERLVDKVERVLKDAFRGARPELEQGKPSDKIGGFLIWEGFSGIEQIDRQRALSKALKEGLGKQDLNRITTILAATPEEATVMREESAAQT